MKKKIENLCTAFAILFNVWILLSFIEIISKNLSEHPHYFSANFFNILIRLFTNS